MPLIQIPTMLRTFTDGRRGVRVEAATLGEALDQLVRRHPEVASRLMDREGKVSPGVHVFVGEDDHRRMAGLRTPLTEDEVVLIVPAAAGGA